MSELREEIRSTPRKPKIANFDSATAMLRALADHLHDEDFIALGSFPRWSTPFMSVVGQTVNRLPGVLRNAVYTVSGWTEAVPQRKITGPRTDTAGVASWLCSHYPRRRYAAARHPLVATDVSDAGGAS